MPWFNLKEILFGIAVGFLAGAGITWTIQGWRMDALEAEYIADKAKAVQQEFDRANQISNDYAQVVRWLNEQRQKRAQSALVEVQKAEYLNPDCIRPESGRLLINDAVREANAARLPDATVQRLTRDAAKRDDANAGALGTSGDRRLPRLRIE